MKRAIVHIRADDVRTLLGLSADVRVVGFHVEPDRDGITLRLEGEGLPKCCEVCHGPNWRAPELDAPVRVRTVLEFGEWA